jgi:NhaA family Na+:H+ antiporter
MKRIVHFLNMEVVGGIILFVMALAAFIVCNSSFFEVYQQFWQTPHTLHVATYEIIQPWLFWLNEGLMTLFFLLIGLEIKREFLEGALRRFSQIALPAVAAVGGMAVPALIYCIINRHDELGLQGWAMPVATDIAFALGVLSLFGRRVPLELKLFLMALAIFDDIGAIIIVAVNHITTTSPGAVWGAIAAIIVLLLFNTYNLRRVSSYLTVGIVLWLCLLYSGVQATIAGVILACMIPLQKISDEKKGSPLVRLERVLHPAVMFFVMPLFAFANAGVPLQGVSFNILLNTVALGTISGLFLGKQLGVFGFAWAMIKLGWAKLPAETTWLAFYGVTILCGIGFTMSLFLGTLAFAKINSDYMLQVRLGVLIGSLLSGIIGAMVLQIAFRKKS